MTGFVARHVALEMFVLSLLELLLTFALAYVLLMPGAGHDTIGWRPANIAGLIALTSGITAFTIGLYRPEMFLRIRTLLVNTVLGAMLAFPPAWLISKLAGVSDFYPVGYDALRPLKIAAIWIGAVVAIRIVFLLAVRLHLFSNRIAIVGLDDVSATLAAVRSARRGAVEVVSPPPDERSPKALRRAKIRRLVVSPAALTDLPATALADYAQAGIQIETESEFWERQLKRVDIAHLDDAWLAALEQATARESLVARLRAPVHRGLDILTSLVFLLITCPLIAIIVVLIRLDSTGPILYRQERVGLNGVPFTVLKFRSMRVNAEARGPAWAQQRDPRVTRVGSFMRRTRIDELPQLINVLRGEMGFIGPRPERPHFVDQLATAIPYYEERSRVKPGLTGWAQVNYPYGASVEDAKAKLSYDLYYVKNRSVMLDLLILFATVRVILFQEGSR